MEIGIWVTVIGGILTIVNSWFIVKANKGKNLADINKTNAESINIQVDSSIKLIEELRTQLNIQKSEIVSLQEEIKILKSQEITEKLRFEIKVKELEEENNKLRSEVEDNKLIYTSQIKKLNEQIVSLKASINKKQNTKVI